VAIRLNLSQLENLIKNLLNSTLVCATLLAVSSAFAGTDSYDDRMSLRMERFQLKGARQGEAHMSASEKQTLRRADGEPIHSLKDKRRSVQRVSLEDLS
jgi:hypothetical protein